MFHPEEQADSHKPFHLTERSIQIKMKRKSRIREKFENNGLIIIVMMMVVIYGVFDFLSGGHYVTRILISVSVVIYAVFTQTIINSRKAMLEAKETAQQRLIESERLTALGAMAAGIAHEVKSPMATTIQGIEFLKSSLYDDARLLEVTYRIEKSVLRLDDIVKGLLSFSHEISLKMEEMDIGPVIDEALSLVDHQMQLKKIRVLRKYESNLPKITMDGNQIKQVFTNLFINAIEAMKQEGILGIRTEQRKGELDQGSVKIVVSDTGEGIPGGSIRKIFDPFFTTKKTEGNTGLGLSVAKGIIDKHNGTIEIESDPGLGTRVIIGLPTGRL
jgi:two-component system NtrC family sensor kinase